MITDRGAARTEPTAGNGVDRTGLEGLVPDEELGKGLTRKGLSEGSVGLLGATVVGISCVAPGYTLAAALGPTAAVVGRQTPAVVLLGFIPMLLVAFGYRELNKAMPDSGTSFTWATRAFGPWVGWMAGWGLSAATILVLSNTAGVAVDFFYLMLSQIVGDPHLAALTQNPWINVGTCFAFMLVAGWISYRGMETTKAVQYVLVGLQCVALVIFSIAALMAVRSGHAFDPHPIRLDWFNPLAIPSLSALSAGLSLSFFMFFGWEVTLTMNEETKGARSTPGQAATATVVITLFLYALAAAASISFAGVGVRGLGLGNPAIQGNAFFALAGPVLGSFAILMSLAVLASSAASLQSTMVSPARTLLAMGHYGALPKTFGSIDARFRTPGVATIVSTVVSSVFYGVMRFVSENVLRDTVTALGIMICFYYSITAFASAWYFRRQFLRSVYNFFFQFLFPTLGGVMLLGLFIKTLTDSEKPSFGSGSEIGGLGLVFIIGVGVLAVGAIIMALMAWVSPDFFRGRTLATHASDGTEDHGLDQLPV